MLLKELDETTTRIDYNLIINLAKQLAIDTYNNAQRERDVWGRDMRCMTGAEVQTPGWDTTRDKIRDEFVHFEHGIGATQTARIIGDDFEGHAVWEAFNQTTY